MDPRLLRIVRLKDRIARWVVTAGGVVIILSVLAIFFLMAWVAAPLFFAATAEKTAQRALPPDRAARSVLAVGTGDYLETLFVLTDDGAFTFVAARGGSAPSRLMARPPGAGSPKVVSAEVSGALRYSLGWSNGWVTLEKIAFPTRFDRAGKRHIDRKLTRLAAVPPWAAGQPPAMAVARQDEEGRTTAAALLPGNRLAITQLVRSENLLGEVESETHRFAVADRLPGPIAALTLNADGTSLFAGTRNGYLLRWELAEPGEVRLLETTLAFQDRRAVTALALLGGDATLVVGDERGGITTWFPLVSNLEGGARTLRKMMTMQPHDSEVVAIQPSRRSRSLATRSRLGAVHFDHATTGERLLALPAGQPLVATGVSPRFDGLAGVDAAGNLVLWETKIPHPEAGARSFFGKVWYESYREPAFVWQSSSGDDDFEPKLSLVPLVFGTLKGTLYGMLFAVPLGVFGALYTSHLMRAELRQVIKPAVEVMGSVPSVVIGFLAALWLAPIVKASLLAFFLILALLPLLAVAVFFLWERLEARWPLRSARRGREFLLLAPLVVLAVWGSFALGGVVEQSWFGGDLSQWLFENLDIRVDQRNSLVIAFALGFAVVPIIFTMADDALVNIPRSLTAASLALGASRWQTVWRVALPSASPGIFAAVMIGFGRAVGETMIVLMATGNTPIMDWGPFNGMRTLSANIAVEIPEAPVDSTLYRTLFLSAVVLFLVTFLLNSVAEVVRQRLRRKFSNY